MQIYLDHNATTPLRPEVLEAVTQCLRDEFGNPSSPHGRGASARALLERARRQVAECLGAESDEITFTAGATEANNMALYASVRRAGLGKAHVVTSSVEHPSIEEPLADLESGGCRVTRVPVNADGRLDPDAVKAALEPETILVSVLWANNETGVIQPVEDIATFVKERGILFHTDATQALGKIVVDARRVPFDLLSASGHKLNAPKGVGFLYQRSPLKLEPHLRGGPQERRRRGGTENLASAVGLGVACELARREVAERAHTYATLRDRLWKGIEQVVPRVRRNGSAEHCLPNTLNVEFEGTPGDILLEALDLEGVCVSAGAACASGSIEPSHVLSAMGHTPEQARGSLRFSVGYGVDAEQIDRVLALLPARVERARSAGLS